jgi:diguanylate cyclase (GGDEF)-like protein/PAS domain S-box-containing protein
MMGGMSDEDGADGAGGASGVVPGWWDQVPGAHLLLRGGTVVAADGAARQLGHGLDAGFDLAAALYDDDDRLALAAALDELDELDDLAAGRVGVLVRIGPPPSLYAHLALAPAGALVVALVTDRTQEHRLDESIAAFDNRFAFLVDRDGKLIWRPPGNQKRLGMTDEEMVGARVAKFIHPDDMTHVIERFLDVLEHPDRTSVATVRVYRRSTDTWYDSTLSAVNRLDDPAFGGVLMQSVEEYPAEPTHHDPLRAAGDRFMSLAEVAPVGILAGDRQGAVLYRNERARQLVGGEDATADLRALVARTDDAHRGRLEAVLAQVRRADGRGSLMAPMRRPDGERAWLQVDATPQTSAAGEVLGWVVSLQDLTAEVEIREELRRAQERLFELATRDHLTGLYNRAAMMERLQAALARQGTGGPAPCVLLVDLDAFKPVNDELGHAAGDEVLAELAARLGRAVEGWGVIGRFGGDEFLVLVEEPRPADGDLEARLAVWAEGLVAAAAQPVAVAGRTVQVGASVGWARAVEGQHASELIGRADAAMYAAKRHKRTG